MLKMYGYDDCVIGVVERNGEEPILCYSTDLVIRKLMQEDGMSHEEAYEFFEYNQLGAYMGEGTPCFLRDLYDGELEDK